MNRFRRGRGEMFDDDPCMRLQSKNSTDPAGPVHCSIPWRSNRVVRLASSGTPTSCTLSERSCLAGGVGSGQVTNHLCEPGITSSEPFHGSLRSEEHTSELQSLMRIS